MRELINYSLRVAISLLIFSMSYLLFIRKQIALKTYRRRQLKIKNKLQIEGHPIHDYDSFTEKNIESLYQNHQGQKYFALTSGSTNKPKKIFYSSQRVSSTKKNYMESMVTIMGDQLHLKTFFVFASHKKDSSLTSLMAKESGQLRYIESCRHLTGY